LILLRSSPLALLLYLMVIAQGLLGYGLTPVMGAIPAEIFEGLDYGSIFGSVMLAAILGGAAGPGVTGAMYDRLGTYLPAFSLSIVLSLVSAMSSDWPRPARLGRGREAMAVVRVGWLFHRCNLAYPSRTAKPC
jgi:MFS family permease